MTPGAEHRAAAGLAVQHECPLGGRETPYYTIICICICMYIYIYTHICIYIYIYTCVYDNILYSTII